MIVLDTNIHSALMRPTPEPGVAAWLDNQLWGSIWTTSITVLEVRFGLQIIAGGEERSGLLQVFELMLDTIDHRSAAFEDAAAQKAADLMATRQRKGRSGDLRDSMIAGIVLARHASLATRNPAHFSDLPASVVNPWPA
jgi:predicted nucleic acid-binding protein